jgi:hypothetical protein
VPALDLQVAGPGQGRQRLVRAARCAGLHVGSISPFRAGSSPADSATAAQRRAWQARRRGRPGSKVRARLRLMTPPSAEPYATGEARPRSVVVRGSSNGHGRSNGRYLRHPRGRRRPPHASPRHTVPECDVRAAGGARRGFRRASSRSTISADQDSCSALVRSRSPNAA